MSLLPNKNNDFFANVWQVARLIPYGRVTSYGAIAAYLGAKSGARMVGWAMNLSHLQNPPVPAHRVVNRNGQLTGKMHFTTPTQMEENLAAEGVQIHNNTVQNFEALFWDPTTELSI